jgi:hypothetical protein
MTGIWVGRTWVRIPAQAIYISLLHNVHTGSETHKVSFSTGSGPLSAKVKRSGPKADQSSHLVLRLCEWSYTSAPLYAFRT